MELGSKPEITIENVEKWVNKDLTMAINLLDAVQKDPDTLRALAVFLHGRWINHVNSIQADMDKSVNQ